MNEFEVLLGFLNAAVAFAGFTGVVALIDQRSAHVSRDVVSFRIRTLIASSLCVITLSVMPIFFKSFNLPSNVMWRVGCGIMTTVGAAYLILILRARAVG